MVLALTMNKYICNVHVIAAVMTCVECLSLGSSTATKVPIVDFAEVYARYDAFLLDQFGVVHVSRKRSRKLVSGVVVVYSAQHFAPRFVGSTAARECRMVTCATLGRRSAYVIFRKPESGWLCYRTRRSDVKIPSSAFIVSSVACART